MGMFGDLVALAKAGYSPAEVKEILGMTGGAEADKPEAAAAIPPKEEAQPDQQKQEPAEAPKPSEDSSAKVKQLEESVQRLTTELNKTKKDLEAAQKLNTSRESSGQKAPERTIDDIVRGFM